MKRALYLAKKGRGNVSPNPMVGCVIVHHGKIIGEGYHKVYGGPHAEVNAVNSVDNADLLEGADVYVTLEPCSHYGKTPPCSLLLSQSRVKRVFIANLDPNPLVKNNGVTMLENSGIEVITGLLSKEALKLNKRFFSFMDKKRPYIILKFAQTTDGFMARANFDSKWISNESSRKLVHKWRAEEDAILVGKNTVKYDNPSLNVREWTGKNPLRVVIDHTLSLKLTDHIVKRKELPIVCYNQNLEGTIDDIEYVRLPENNFLNELLSDLHKRKIMSLIVEGGGHTLREFLQYGLWDEARIFTSSAHFGQGISAPKFTGEFEENYRIDDDLLQVITH